MGCALFSVDFMDHGGVKFRRATSTDLTGIIHLLATRQADDMRRLRWLPEPFQSRSIAQQIEKKRLFVAVNETDGVIISLRNAFIVDDKDELDALLVQDLRHGHAQRELDSHGFFNLDGEFFSQRHEHFISTKQILYMHVGSAFTHYTYRGRCINGRLTTYAFQQLHQDVLGKIKNYNYTTIALMYGLIDDNAWRTRYLVRRFLPFAHSLSKDLAFAPREKLSFYAYKRVKPEFTLSPSGDLIRLPDDQCVPVLGCVLVYELGN